MGQLHKATESKFFYGWWIVISCSMIGLLAGSSRFSFTMFFPTLLDDLGWTRAMLGFGLTLHMWVYAVSVIAAGYFVDKYGARIIMCVGGFIIIIGLTLTSTMTKVWQFYLYYGFILAVGVAFCFMVPILGTVRKWFIKKAGLALAFTNVGAGLAGVLMAVLIPGMLKTYGWRDSWLYLGVGFGILIVLLAAIFVRKDPESMGVLPDGVSKPDELSIQAHETEPPEAEEIWTVGEAVKTRSFWCFLAGGCISSIPGIGITAHIVNWAVDIGKASNIAPADAMGHIKLAVALSAVFTMVGAMTGGPLSDKIGRKLVICISLLLDAMLFIAVAKINSLSSVIGAAAAMGFFGGLIGPAWGAYVGDIFGRYALATIFSLFIFSIGIVGGTGSVLFGWIHDVSGSYNWAWLLSSFCMIITCILYFFTRKEIKAVGTDTV